MPELDLGTFTVGDNWPAPPGDPIPDLTALAELLRKRPPRQSEIVVRQGLRAVWDELIRCVAALPAPRFIAVRWLAFRQPYQERERSSGCVNISAQRRNSARLAAEIEREQTCFVNRLTGVVACSPRVLNEVRAALEVANGSQAS